MIGSGISDASIQDYTEWQRFVHLLRDRGKEGEGGMHQGNWTGGQSFKDNQSKVLVQCISSMSINRYSFRPAELYIRLRRRAMHMYTHSLSTTKRFLMKILFNPEPIQSWTTFTVCHFFGTTKTVIHLNWSVIFYRDNNSRDVAVKMPSRGDLLYWVYKMIVTKDTPIQLISYSLFPSHLYPSSQPFVYKWLGHGDQEIM